MNPEQLLVHLARHGIVFDSPITSEQILSHFKGVPAGSHAAHLLADLARQVLVRKICGDEPITSTPPYP